MVQVIGPQHLEGGGDHRQHLYGCDLLIRKNKIWQPLKYSNLCFGDSLVNKQVYITFILNYLTIIYYISEAGLLYLLFNPIFLLLFRYVKTQLEDIISKFQSHQFFNQQLYKATFYKVFTNQFLNSLIFLLLHAKYNKPVRFNDTSENELTSCMEVLIVSIRHQT